MTDTIRIDELPITVLPSLTHVFPSMKDGQTFQLTIQQVADVILPLLIDGSPEALNTLNELSAALGDDANFATTVTDLIGARIPFFATGAALPVTDQGPIWHEDYKSMMTWQVFDANGASYTGYASHNIGQPVADGQSSSRPGWLKRNGASLSDVTYAPLKAWAQHNGLFVTLGSWAAGSFNFADNGDGTFIIPDNRGEFERLWDDGRGIDTGRVFGSAQLDALQNLTGDIVWHGINTATMVSSETGVFGRNGTNANYSAHNVTGGANSAQGLTFDASNVARTSTETRGRNVALLACIKF